MTEPAPQIGATPTVRRAGEIAVLSMGSGEGRFNGESVPALEACLDEVLASDATALVTIAEGKIWSNGLDVDWLKAHPARAAQTVRHAEAVFARVLTFPIPTVAALSGHVFAGGMFLALAHDLRIMRSDRGYLCLPEVDLGVVFSPGMFALLTSTMTAPVAHRALVLGHRFTAAEAIAGGLVTEAVPMDELLERALAVAGGLAGKKRTVLAELKQHIYADAVAKLGAELPAPAMLRDLGVDVP